MRKERDNLGKEIDGNKSTLRRVRRPGRERKPKMELRKGRRRLTALSKK